MRRCLLVVSSPSQTLTFRVTTAGSVMTTNAEQLVDLTRDRDEKLKSVSWIV